MIAAWLDIGASAALLGVVVVAAAGLGDCLLRALGATVASALERAVLTVTLGLCGLAHAMLLLGALHLLYPAAAILIVGACLWPGLRCARLLAGALRREERWPRPAWQRAVLLVLLAAIGLNFLATLAPVSSADAIAYRFVAIKHMVSEHRLLALPWSWRTYQPFHVEMLFLLGTLLKSDSFGALFAWLFGVLIVLAMVPIARRQFAPGRSLVAAALFYVSGLIAWESTSAFVELGLALFALLALAKLLEWCAQPVADRLRLAGVFAGVAAGTKHHGSVVLALLAALLVISCWRLRRAVPRALATMLVPAVLLALPWWIRSFALTGNPVFPFFARLFASRSLDPVLDQIAAQYGLGKDLASWLLAPWNLTLRGRAFDGGELLGPAYLALLPLVLWRAPRAATAFAAAYASVWFATSQQARFLLPVLPWLALACSRLAMIASRRVRRVACACVVVAVGSGALVTLGYGAQFLPVVLGLASRDAFLAAKTPHYRELQWLNQHLAHRCKVLMIGVLPYYCELDCAWPSQQLADLGQAQLAGFDYVLTGAALPDVLANHLEPVREWRSRVPISRTFSDRVMVIPTVLWRNKRVQPCVSCSW